MEEVLMGQSIPYLTRDQMREVDRAMVEDFHIELQREIGITEDLRAPVSINFPLRGDRGTRQTESDNKN